MRWNRRRSASVILLYAAATLAAAPRACPAQDPPEIAPNELSKRPEFVGKEIVVDARVALYQFRPGRGFDEIVLKQSDVPLRLPQNLRFASAPTQHVVRARGVLTKQGNDLFVDVKSLTLMAEDRERLEKGLALVPAGDSNTRRAWAKWAARRASIYKDEALDARAKAIEGELIVAEAARPESQSPDAAMALVARARELGHPPEPVPTAWVHRALNARFKTARSAEALRALADEVSKNLPNARDTQSARNIDLTSWRERYQADPAATYLLASSDIQAALDRALLANILERWFQTRANDDPSLAIELSTEAGNALPDRPEISRDLLDRGLKSAAQRVGSLRQSEVLALANRFTELGQNSEARAVIRAWLQDQRDNKLGRNDADGRVALAEQYRNLLGDSETSIALLQEAAALDPRSNEVAEAFRTLGYRFDGQRWVDAKQAGQIANDAPQPDLTDPLIGLTQEEILSQHGKPHIRSVSISQGLVLIQWCYRLPTGGTEYIEFVQRPGSPATVESRYILR